MTITDLCEELKNYFDYERRHGNFTISDSTIVLDDYLSNGQYFRIVGSRFNDGVYKYPASGLKNETFNGAIWAMAVPPAVVTLMGEMNDWLERYGASDAAQSPFQSESFGGYSYSKGGSGSGDANDSNTWQGHFRGRLNKYRKIRKL